MCKEYLPVFNHFYKGNFCDFLFASTETKKPFQIGVFSSQKEFAPEGANSLLEKSGTLFKGTIISICIRKCIT